MDELELNVFERKEQLVDHLSKHYAGFAQVKKSDSAALHASGKEQSELSSTAQEMKCGGCGKYGHILGSPLCKRPRWHARPPKRTARTTLPEMSSCEEEPRGSDAVDLCQQQLNAALPRQGSD